MPGPGQQFPPGQYPPPPRNQPFVPSPQDPYCNPNQIPAYQETYETYEYEVSPETEKQLDIKEETPLFAVSDEVVEHDVNAEKVVEAPNLKESTVDLSTASVVGMNDEKDTKTNEDGIFKSDEEIVIEKKEEVWKPPDAED
jgi:hypothetical protein